MPLCCFVGVGGITVEAVHRLIDGEADGKTVMIGAAVGIIMNGVTALFARGRNGDLNVKGAILHTAADAAVSAAPTLMC
jgi:cobalt-zinc-cadmium efflux system protein